MDIWSQLKNQSLGRVLTAQESALADALEAIYITGEHDFTKVCAALKAKGFDFTPQTLEAELTAINTSLDQAYQVSGLGA